MNDAIRRKNCAQLIFQRRRIAIVQRGAKLIDELFVLLMNVRCHLDYPLTAPAAKPLTNCFWKKMIRMTMGMVADTAAAEAIVI